MTIRLALSAVVPAAALLLAACGGGGTAIPAAPAAPQAPAEVVFGGVAATGAPLALASVKVFERSGSVVCDTTTDAQGAYSCTLASGAAAPFTLIARLGDQALYSTAASATSTTVNLTPLTTLIVARLSPSGDPARLVEAIAADPSLVDATKLQARVDEVRALLAPLLSAIGDRIDPISGSFAANGSGHDKVLDSLQINIRPEGGSSNIQITVKVLPASDGSAPLQLSFKSGDAAPAPLTATIDAAALVGDGTAARLAGLMQRMTVCYALPLAQRIANVAEGAATASGGAGEVAAPACMGLFIDDDPASYKDNGIAIGSAGAFPGLFRQSSTGAKFEHANFEYQRANGDVFITFRSTTATGSVAHQTLTVREQGGLMKVVGNQYSHDATVRAYVADREFPFQPAFSYFGSGYNVQIPNRTDPVSGQSLYTQAVVTTPNGAQLTYRPTPGRSLMGIVRANGSTSGTSVEFFASAFQDSATAGSPSSKDSSLIFSNPQRSDAEVLAIPDQGVWTVEWVHADPARANVTQSYRTISRAPTIAEVRQMRFAQMTPTFKAELLADAAAASAGGFVFGVPSASEPNVADISTQSGGDAWAVPDGAMAPTSITVFGVSSGGVSFNDTVQVMSTDRRALITCSRQSAGDPHCDGSTGVNQFAAGAKTHVLEFWGRNARQVELTKLIATYKLAP